MREERGYMRLNEAFQYVDDRFLDIVEQERRKYKKKPVWLTFVSVAACACLLLLLPLGAMAYNWFGLRDLLLREENDFSYQRKNPYRQQGVFPEDHRYDKENRPGSPEVEGSAKEDIPVALIGLSGYRESPEAQALEEWMAFLKNCDTPAENDFVAEGREDWGLYAVDSWEMGKKLDEIAAKYGLKLHSQINGVSEEELEDRVGGGFLSEDCAQYWGYIYENGTFQCEGDVEMEGAGLVDFQLRRFVKGTFDDVVLNIQEVDDYAEWQHVTDGGEVVMLASGGGKSLIFADFEDCFISVNILCGRNGGMGEENLRVFADKINFTLLKEVSVPEMRGDSVPPRYEVETVDIGPMGNLGVGRLIRVASDQDDQDYRLYFFRTEDTSWLFHPEECLPEEADYVFADVREGNVSIGKFWQIYYVDFADITGDGSFDFIVVARYETEEGIRYDTRIYEWTGEGYSPNYEWMDKMNREYCDPEEYPVDMLMALPRQER